MIEKMTLMPLNILTPRESEVLKFFGETGANSAEIARALTIGSGTVEGHFRHISQKLGLTNRVEVLNYYLCSLTGKNLPIQNLSQNPYLKALTKRELNVLEELNKGKKYQEISDELVITEKTTKNHVLNICAKLGISSRYQASIISWAGDNPEYLGAPDTGETDQPIEDNNLHRKFLTRRENEVLEILRKGASNRAIAEALVISPRTVENHVRNILLKLGVHSRRANAVSDQGVLTRQLIYAIFLPNMGNAKEGELRPLRDYPLGALLADPRIVPAGLPGTDGLVPFVIRNVAGLEPIQADYGKWRDNYSQAHAFASLFRDFKEGSLQTEFEAQKVRQIFKNRFRTQRGEAHELVTATISEQEPYFTLDEALREAEVSWTFTPRYEGFCAIYDKEGRLKSIRVKAEGPLFDRDVASIEVGPEVLTRGELKYAKYWNDRYIGDSEIGEEQIRIPFVRFRHTTGSVIRAVFPIQRDLKKELGEAYLNKPMWSNKKLLD